MKTANMRHISILTLLALLSISMTSCHDEPGGGDDSGQDIRRTVLVYQVAANNLGDSSYDQMDIQEMVVGAREGALPSDCSLLVYNSRNKQGAHLLEITRTGIDTLKTYGTDILSVDSRRMLEVFDDMEALRPASDYGLVLWSHGSGWLQDGIADDNDTSIQPLSFGSEGRPGKTMNITTLANTIAKGPKLSFLYFDCCYMASVETLYELRHSTPYIVASATELLVYGMPYDKNIACFFAENTPDLIEAAENTFTLYNNESGSNRTCTMSVIDTSRLDELAQATAAIYKAADASLPAGYSPQRFMSYHVTPCYYYDFGDYVKALCLTDGKERFDGAEELFAAYSETLSEAVLYAKATPYLWNSVPLTHHCGLSTNILQSESNASVKNYYTLSWYSDVAKELFNK